mmetsp:Transcript_35996/g.90444  ORF Transcript_35996/g.90444 Transcript_35996/m.90444 type:complete len:268 (+) Transcript_35996:733-1536(+)
MIRPSRGVTRKRRTPSLRSSVFWQPPRARRLRHCSLRMRCFANGSAAFLRPWSALSSLLSGSAHPRCVEARSHRKAPRQSSNTEKMIYFVCPSLALGSMPMSVSLKCLHRGCGGPKSPAQARKLWPLPSGLSPGKYLTSSTHTSLRKRAPQKRTPCLVPHDLVLGTLVLLAPSSVLGPCHNCRCPIKSAVQKRASFPRFPSQAVGTPVHRSCFLRTLRHGAFEKKTSPPRIQSPVQRAALLLTHNPSLTPRRDCRVLRKTATRMRAS